MTIEEQLQNHRVNDEAIKKMTETWIQWNGGEYTKRFIENKLLYGFRNEELNLENMLMVSSWVEEIDNANNYAEAYYKFITFLGGRYGADFLEEHCIEKENATPMRAKILYEQDFKYHEKFEGTLVPEYFIRRICGLGLAHLYLIPGMLCLSRYGFIPFILGMSANILVDIGFYTREFGIPLFVESLEGENVVNAYIKKIIYAYKTGNVDKAFLKSEIYNLINLLDNNYNKEIEHVKTKANDE